MKVEIFLTARVCVEVETDEFIPFTPGSIGDGHHLVQAAWRKLDYFSCQSPTGISIAPLAANPGDTEIAFEDPGLEYSYDYPSVYVAGLENK